jgi:hypothetical protein
MPVNLLLIEALRRVRHLILTLHRNRGNPLDFRRRAISFAGPEDPQ